jgi:integrase
MRKELSAREKAALMGINVQTLYRKARRGEVQFKRYGRTIRFFPDDSPQQASKTLIIEAPTCFNLKIFDEMNLKGGQKMSKLKKRWNYGKRGVFLRELPSGKENWYYWLTDGHGKRNVLACKGATTRAEAAIIMEHAYKEQFKKKYLPEGKKRITFAELATEYLEHAEFDKDSWESDKYNLNRLNPFFGEMKVDQIRFDHVTNYRKKLKKEGLADGTVNRHLGLLRRIINWAKDMNYEVPEDNPVRSKDHIKKVPARDVTLDIEHERLLICYADENLKPIIVTALHTGMRKGEILSLEWSDVDFESRKIHVRAEVEKNSRDRYIYIDRILYSVLEALHNQNGHSRYVFGYYNETKKEYCRYADITKPFKNAKDRVKEETGLDLSHLHFHDLRHTFATRFLDAAKDYAKLMKILGHSNLDTTMKYVNRRDIETDSGIKDYEKRYYSSDISDILSQNSIHDEENLVSYRVS